MSQLGFDSGPNKQLYGIFIFSYSTLKQDYNYSDHSETCVLNLNNPVLLIHIRELRTHTWIQ